MSTLSDLFGRNLDGMHLQSFISWLVLQLSVLAKSRFRLMARVSSSNPDAVGAVLRKMVKGGTVRVAEGEFVLEIDIEGGSAKELNRSLLSTLRRVEKRTRLRAEWTSDDGMTERYFDYVLKKKFKTDPS